MKKSARETRKSENTCNRGAQQDSDTSARAVLHHPHPARYVGAQSPDEARTTDSRKDADGGSELEAGQCERTSWHASSSKRVWAQELQHLGFKTVCNLKNVIAGAPR